MNLIEKEEKIIIEQYDVVFKNFIFKMTMKINTKFFIRFKTLTFRKLETVLTQTITKV